MGMFLEDQYGRAENGWLFWVWLQSLTTSNKYVNASKTIQEIQDTVQD